MMTLFCKIRQRYKYFRLEGKPVLIYSMGKTGTKTIHRSLEDYVFLHRVPFVDEKLMPSFKYWSGSRRKLHFRVKEKLQNNDNGWKIITLTREQVGCDIAGFFESMDKPHLRQFLGDRKKIRRMPVSELIDSYLKVRILAFPANI